ncbi:MAG TPA: TonB-dependent receptor [Steroidobacteraceae bacterium]|jgi:Outer membrane receptor proteins, mostly Fe transport|nr:TonB-dependent receptor [Steroidobacteraceae bacterium]
MKRYGRSKSTMTGLVTVSGLMVGLNATPAAAQNAGANAETPEQGVLQEVVVSARREQESVQDIPTSITAFTPEQLEQHQMTSTQDLEEFTPNLRIDIGARAVNADFSIRGVTPQGAGGSPTTNPAVGQYINGIYNGSRIVNVMSTLDIERIEVLRGPQGTLFGKNTTAGAVNIVTHRPTKEAEGEVMVRTGSHNRQDARLIVNAPIGETLFARAAIGQDKQDGYYTNLTYNDDTSDRNVKTYQAALRWVPSDDLTFDATWSYMDQNENNRGGDCRFVQEVGFQRLYNSLSGDNFEARCRESEAAGRYKYYADERGFLNATSESITGEAAWEGGEMGIFDDIGVKASVGRRTFGYRFTVDVDMTNAPLETRGHFGPAVYPQGGESFTSEIVSHAQIGFADIIFGYSYIDEAGHEGGPKSQCWAQYAAVVGTGQSVTCTGASGFYFGNNPLNTTGSGASPFVTHESGSSITRGLFTHIKWQFLPWFRLETGARYTKDHKDFFNVEGSVTPTNDFRGFTWVLNDDTVDLFGEGSTEFSKTTPTVSLNFMTPEPIGFVDDGLMYLLWSQGFQSGGFNTELEVSRIPQLEPLLVFKPETLDNYEIGFKTTLLDRRLRLNLALFRMKYKDKQEAINIDNANGEFGPNAAIEVIQNAAEATIDGYELEFQALLGAGFSIDGGLARQKPEYTDYTVFDPETGALVDLTGTPVNTQPENTFTGNINWNTTFASGGDLSARVGLYWQDETDTGITTASQIAAGEQTQCHQDSYTTFNARVGWTDPRDRWTVALSGRNLTNETVLDACTLSIATRGVWHPIYQDERTWALEAMYRFGM